METTPKWVPQPRRAHSPSSPPRRTPNGLSSTKTTPVQFLAPTVFHYTAAIGACKACKQQGPALELFEEMRRRGVEPNGFTYSSLVACCSDGRVARRLLEDMKVHGVAPNVHTWSAAIAACHRFVAASKGQKGQGALALEFLDEMVDAGVTPNQYSYASAIHAVSRDPALPWHSCLELLDAARQADSSGGNSVVAYSAAIAGCGEAGRASDALDLLKQMLDEGVEPNEITLNSVITACEKGYHADHAVALLEQMEEDHDTRAARLQGHHHHGHGQQQQRRGAGGRGADRNARRGGAERRRLGSVNVFEPSSDFLFPSPSIVTYNAAISACKAVGQWERALALLERAKRRVKPDMITFNTCISACERGMVYRQQPHHHHHHRGSSDDDDDAWAEEEEIEEDDGWVSRWEAGWSADDFDHSVVVGGEEEERVESSHGGGSRRGTLRSRSSSTGRSRAGRPGVNANGAASPEKTKVADDPTEASKNKPTLANKRKRRRSWPQMDAALALLNDAKRAGLRPDFITYSALLAACHKAGEGALALELLDEMEGRGIPATMYSFATAISACEAAGMWKEALALLLRMRGGHPSATAAPQSSSSSRLAVSHGAPPLYPGPSLYAKVLGCLAKHQKVRHVLAVFKLLREDLPMFEDHFQRMERAAAAAALSSGGGNMMAAPVRHDFGSESYDLMAQAFAQEKQEAMTKAETSRVDKALAAVSVVGVGTGVSSSSLSASQTAVAASALEGNADAAASSPSAASFGEVDLLPPFPLQSSRQRRGLSKAQASRQRAETLKALTKQQRRAQSSNSFGQQESPRVSAGDENTFGGFGAYSNEAAAAEVAARATGGASSDDDTDSDDDDAAAAPSVLATWLKGGKGSVVVHTNINDSESVASSSVAGTEENEDGLEEEFDEEEDVGASEAAWRSEQGQQDQQPQHPRQSGQQWLEGLYASLLDYGNADPALALLQDMRQHGVRVDPGVYSKVIELCAEEVGRADTVCSLMVDMVAPSTPSSPVSSSSSSSSAQQQQQQSLPPLELQRFGGVLQKADSRDPSEQTPTIVPSVADFLHVIQAAEIDEEFVDLVDFGLDTLIIPDSHDHDDDHHLLGNQHHLDDAPESVGEDRRRRELEANAVVEVCAAVAATAAATTSSSGGDSKGAGGGGDCAEAPAAAAAAAAAAAKRAEAARALEALGTSGNIAGTSGGVITALLRRMRAAVAAASANGPAGGGLPSRGEEGSEIGREGRRRRGLSPLGLLPVAVYNNAFAACDRTEQFHDLLAAIVLMQQPVESAEAEVEEGDGRAQVVTAVKEVTQGADDRTVEMSSGLVGMYGRRHEWEGTLDLVARLQDVGVPLSRGTYLSVLSALEKAGRWQEALAQLEAMSSAGISLDVVAYSAVISACEKGGAWEKALALLDEMRDKGVKPNVVSYNAAISACAKSKRWAEGLEVFEAMKVHRVLPDAVTFNALFTALSTSSNRVAEEVLESVYEEGVRRGVLWHWSRSQKFAMDLHSFSVPMSKTAVRIVLKQMLVKAQQESGMPSFQNEQEEVKGGNDDDGGVRWKRSGTAGWRVHSMHQDLVVITGIGKGSEGGKSVIQPEIRRMLREEFNPPLVAHIMPGNKGRLVVKAKDLEQWVATQLFS